MIPIPFLNNYWICGKLVKQEDFLPVSHEVPWYLVPKSLPSLHSHRSIFHILFSSNTELLCNSYPAPCTHAVVTSRPLCSPLSMESALPSFQSWPLLHTPTAVLPPNTPGLHCHSQIVLFLSVYVSVLPTRPWVLWYLGCVLLTSESPLTPYLAQGEQRVTVDDSIREGIPFFPLSIPPCL